MSKTIVIYGDSISAGTHGEGGYHRQLTAALGADTVYNHAVPASGLSLQTPDNGLTIMRQKENQHPDADLVLVWHGTNDWYWGAALGAAGCGDESTFIGAMEAAMEVLRATSPGAKILWPTPLWRWQQPGGYPGETEGWALPNKNGVTLQDITAAILHHAPRLGAETLAIRDYVHFDESNCDLYTEDRVHPNKAGYDLIWPVLAEALKD